MTYEELSFSVRSFLACSENEAAKMHIRTLLQEIKDRDERIKTISKEKTVFVEREISSFERENIAQNYINRANGLGDFR